MKTLRQACAVAVLTVLLSASAFAGQVNCPGVVSTPPPPTEAESLTTNVILVVVSLIR